MINERYRVLGTWYLVLGTECWVMGVKGYTSSFYYRGFAW